MLMADVTFGLQEDAAGGGHVERRRLGNLARGRNRVSVIGAAAGQNRAFDDRLIALDEFFAHRSPPPTQPSPATPRLLPAPDTRRSICRIRCSLRRGK